MSGSYYKLVGHEAVPVEDMQEWARCFEALDRIVDQTELSPDVRVSTVFLGIDHSFSPIGPPLLFESMTFGGPQDGDQDRYTTWEEAVEGHKRMVEKLRG